MSTQKTPQSRAQVEAAEWLARLGARSISTDTVRAFRDWRDDPANDAAYEEAEAFWEASGEHAADPGLVAMTAEALARGQPAHRHWYRRQAYLWSTAAASIAIAGLAVAFAVTAPRSYATGRNDQQVVQLDDGTKVHLNVDSKVEVRFSKGARHIRLARGEAFFEVTHDALRPFIVEADQTRVRAIGTKFDVRDRGRDVQVTLLEGQVRVQQDAQPASWTLSPNERLVVPDRGAVKKAPIDAVQTVSWTTGRLTFKETSLGDAVAEVNRYSKTRIVLEGDDLSHRLLDGYFDVGDTASFVRGVSLALDLQATGPTDGVITLRERGPAGA
jgi:transmembrane sensor